jgi:hypothetical protein
MILNLINRQADLFEQLNPKRIYVENVRSFFRIPYKLAKLFCEFAVRDKVFLKKYGVYCHNQECGRIIKVYDSIEEIESYISCDICQANERTDYEFDKDSLEIVEFYQLAKGE